MGDDTSRWTQRVIIHCDDMASITRLGEAFVARGFAGKVVGIHDRYPLGGATDRWKRRSVPAPGQCDALIWIHQYKLLEGIDDHRFQVLAFFDVLQNVRSIVQQVGRVIRKSDNDTGLAWVLDHFGGRINRYWQLYKDFDKSVTPDELAQAMSKVLVKDFTDVQPPVLYIDKKFRSVLQIQAEEGAEAPMTPEVVADEVLFERRVTLRKVTRTTTLEELTARIEDALTEGDYEFTKYDVSAVSPDTVIYICAKVDNVPFLNNRYYALQVVEARLVMLLRTRGVVATAGTAAGSGTDALGHLAPVGPGELERIVMPGTQGRISLINSRNTNLSNRVVRRRTISAPSIADVPPILDEHGRVVSTVTGYNGTAPQILDDIDYQETIDEDFDITVRSALPSRNSTEVRLLRRYVGADDRPGFRAGPTAADAGIPALGGITRAPIALQPKLTGSRDSAGRPQQTLSEARSRRGSPPAKGCPERNCPKCSLTARAGQSVFFSTHRPPKRPPVLTGDQFAQVRWVFDYTLPKHPLTAPTHTPLGVWAGRQLS